MTDDKAGELAFGKEKHAKAMQLDSSLKIAFDELIKVDDLQKLQDQFSDAFGVASIITHPDGKPITKPSNFSRLCEHVIRCTEKGRLNCMHSDAVLGRHHPEGPVIQPCLSGGLWDAGASITVGGQHVASWLIGQVRNHVQEDSKMLDYAREIGANEEEFMSAFREIPVMSLDQFQKAAKMLFTMAGQLSDMAYQNLQQARFIEERIKAQSALLESEERYRTTLYSIGDGVITTDTDGRVKIMNPVAEELTGWTQQEASGKKLEDVFPIINEVTREQVEIPVRRVLREGSIVGLANHTILIAKDGTERPIADSGSPIRNEKGEIVGVILVFRDQTEERRGEQALIESEKRFRLLYENAPLSYQSLSPQARLIDVNPTWLRTMGYSGKDEVIGRHFGEFMTAESAELIKNRFADFVTAGEIHNYEFDMVRKDGTIITVSYEGKIGNDEFGQFKQTHCIFTDITEQRKAELALKESEERFRSIIESSPIGNYIYQLQSDGRLIFMGANPSADRIIGIDHHLLLGKTIQQAFPNLADTEVPEMYARIAKGELPTQSFEIDYSEDQINGFFQVTVFRIGNNSVAVDFMDISERKLAEQALFDSEEMMRNSQAVAHICSYSTNLNENEIGKSVWKCSPEFYNIFGIDKTYPHTIEGWAGFIHPDFREETVAYHERVIKERIPFEHEYKIIRINDGAERWVYGTGQLEFDEKGKPIRMHGAIQDITERKMNLEAIQNERTLLRTLIDNLPVSIYVKDAQCRKVVANLTDVENMGYALEKDVLGKTDLELFDGEDGERGYRDDLAVIQTGEPVINRERSFSDPKGTIRWSLTSKLPLFDRKGKVSGLVGISRDITEQKRSLETIQKLSKSIEQSPSIVMITDIYGNIEYVNPKFTEVTGYTSEEIIGQNPRFLKSGEMPSSFYEELWRSITSGGVWRGEFHNRKKNGELYWEWATITSIKNENDKTTNYIAIKEDISLRKQMEAELIIAKEKAEESDRLKSAFLANMSHEIRTPLNSIIGFSELLTDSAFEDDQKTQFIETIIANGNNLLNIISDIVDISKIEAGEITIRNSKIQVKPLLDEIMAMHLMTVEGKRLQFNLTCDESLTDTECSVFADKERLQQIFNNLISNALKFTSEGSIQIGCRLVDNMVEFRVADTGIGIPPEFHAKIFDRFRQVEASYTRKYGGNGLGLAISKNLIELMGGKIWVESEEGKGSAFYFILPLSKI